MAYLLVHLFYSIGHFSRPKMAVTRTSTGLEAVLVHIKFDIYHKYKYQI